MKWLILMILFILLSFYSYSQENEVTLTVDEAVNLAIKNNLKLKAESLDFDEKKWSAYTNWNMFIPSVTMGASLTRINKSILDDAKKTIIDTIKESYKKKGISVTTDQILNDEPYKSTYEENWDNVTKGIVSTKINLDFNFNISMIFGMHQTVLNYQTGKISYDMAKKNLVNQTKNLYFSLIMQRSNIEIKNQTLEASKVRYELAKKKFDMDLISELEKLNAEYAYEKLKPELDDIIINYEDNLASYKNMLGIKKEININLISYFEQNKVELIDPSEMIKIYLKNNHEIKMMDINYKSLQNNRASLIAKLTPSIYLNFLLDPTYQKKDPFNKDTGWFDNIGDNWKESSGSFTFGASLPLDYFFPFSSMQMKIVNNEIEIKKYKYLMESKFQEKEQKIIYLTKKIDQYFNSFKSLELNITMSEKSLYLTELSYKAGLKLLLEVLDAEKDVNDARLALLNAKYNYIVNLNNLEYELNTDLSILNK